MMNFKEQKHEGKKEVTIKGILKEFSETLKSVPAPEQTKEDKKDEKKKVKKEIKKLSKVFENYPDLFEKTIHLLLYDENGDINTLNLLKLRLEIVENFLGINEKKQKEVTIDGILKEFSETLKNVLIIEESKKGKKDEKGKIEEEVKNLSSVFENYPDLFEKTIYLLLYNNENNNINLLSHDENNDINILKLLKYKLEEVKKSLGINESVTYNEKNFEKYKKNLDSKSIEKLNMSKIDFYNFINSKSTIITRKEIPKEGTPTSGRSKDIEPRLPEIKNNF